MVRTMPFQGVNTSSILVKSNVAGKKISQFFCEKNQKNCGYTLYTIDILFVFV